MTYPIADMVERMLSGGIPPEMIVAAVRAAEQHAQTLSGNSTGNSAEFRGTDRVAERRRAYDRERKRRKAATGNSTGNSAESPSLNSKDSKKDTPVEGKKDTGVTRARGRVATRIPDDLVLTDEWREFALTVLPARRVPSEFDTFRDYWRARDGPGATKRDWFATWRNWCRRAAQGYAGFSHANSSNGHAPTRNAGGFASIARQRARDAAIAAGFAPDDDCR